MNIEKNIERLGFTLSKRNKPNQSDMDSLNFIINWINSQQSETIKNNQLFAKMYIYHLNHNIKYYSTNVSEFLPQKELSNLLSTELEHFYQSFTNKLNDNSKNEILDLVHTGVKRKTVEGYTKHPNQYTKEENKIISNNISNLDANQIKQLTQNLWHVDDVSQRLDLMITEALTKFS